MLSKPSKKGLVVIGLIVILMLLLVAAAACGSDEDTKAAGAETSIGGTSTSIPATSGGSTATTDVVDGTGGGFSAERVIVGGKTAEEYEASLPGLEAAVAAAPDDLDALQELAIAQYNTGQYDEAAATYEKMLALNDNSFTRNNYGNVLRDAGKTAEAMAAYEAAIAKDKTLVTAYVNLASLLTRKGKVDEAITVLDRGLQAVRADDKAQLETYRTKLSESR
jgi:tetratricopeptide (TPR) repeat protein